MNTTKQLTLTGNESAEKLQRILGLNPELFTEELFLMLLKRPDVNGRYNCPISDILWKLIKINAFVPTQQAMEAAKVCHFGKRGVEKHDQEPGSVSDLFKYIIGGDKYPKQPWYMLWHLAITHSNDVAKKFPKDHPLWGKLDEAITFELAKKSYRMLFDLIDDQKIHYTFSDTTFLAYAQDRIESHQHDKNPNPYYSRDNLLRDVLYMTSCGIRLSGSFVIWLCHFFGNYEKQETLKTPCYKILMQLLPATKHKSLDQELIQMGIKIGCWEAIVTLARDGNVMLDEATKKSIQAAILAYPHGATSKKLVDMRMRNLITFNAGIIEREVMYLDTTNNHYEEISQNVLDRVKKVWPLLTAEEKEFSEKFIDHRFVSGRFKEYSLLYDYRNTHFSFWVLLLHNLIDITTASPKHKKMFCRWFWSFGISRYPQVAFDWYQKNSTHLTIKVTDIMEQCNLYPKWCDEKNISILNYQGPEQLTAGAWPYVYKITQDLTRQGRGISEENVWKYLKGDNKQLWSLVVYMRIGLLPWFSPTRKQELQEMIVGLMHTLWKDKRIYNAKHTLVDQYHLPKKDDNLHGMPHVPFLLAQQGLIDYLPPIILLEICYLPGFEAMYATQKTRITDEDLRRYLDISNDVAKILFFLSLTKQKKISGKLFTDLQNQVKYLEFEKLLRLNVKNYPVLEHIVAQHGPLH